MALIDDIKTAQLGARKDAATGSVSSLFSKADAQTLTTLIGEAEAISKANGHPVSDVEVVGLIKKFIKGIDEVIKVATAHNIPERIKHALAEKHLMTVFLPKQLTVEQIQQHVTSIIADVEAKTIKDMGKVMNIMKLRFEGLFDGNVVSATIKKQLM